MMVIFGGHTKGDDVGFWGGLSRSAVTSTKNNTDLFACWTGTCSRAGQVATYVSGY
jgi:hypothetical protein